MARQRFAGLRQKKTELVGEFSIGTGNGGSARYQVLGLEPFAVRPQDELRLISRRRWAGFKRRKSVRHLARSGNSNMDVIRLKDTAQVGLVRFALTQALEGCLLVAEGLKEGERNSCALNGCSASVDMASSISTAFISLPVFPWPDALWRGKARP